MIECKWVHEDARSVMGSAKNLGLVAWREAPLPEDIRRWRSLAHELGRAHPAGAACVDLIISGTPRFSNEMRQTAEQFAADAKVFPLGIVHIIELGGLAGAAVRAFISTIILVARPPSPAKAFGDSLSACAWLRPKLTGWREEDIVGAYRALASRIADASARP